MFPVSIAMAATWDPALLHDEATAISDEARAIYNRWHLQPGAAGHTEQPSGGTPIVGTAGYNADAGQVAAVGMGGADSTAHGGASAASGGDSDDGATRSSCRSRRTSSNRGCG